MKNGIMNNNIFNKNSIRVVCAIFYNIITNHYEE